MPTLGGRKPRTLEDRRNAGEYQKKLPVVVGGRPSEEELERPPTHLCTCGKRSRHETYCAAQAWAEVVPQLVAAKLIDRVDRQALEAYALHVSRARALREEIEWSHEEPTYTDGELSNAKTLGRRVRRRTLDEQLRARTQRGFTSNPLLSQEREAWREARMLGELLGLNPVGRTRLAGKGPKPRVLGQLTAGLPERPPLRAVGSTPE